MYLQYKFANNFLVTNFDLWHIPEADALICRQANKNTFSVLLLC